MRWLAALLLIANVTLYLYNSTSERDRRLLTKAPVAPVNQQTMMLKKELKSVRADDVVQCYRIGPFEDVRKESVLREFLDEMQLSYTQKFSSGRKVFLYDLLVRDSQQQQRARQLLGGGVDAGEAPLLVSYFSRSLARKVVQDLRVQDVNATVQKRQAELETSKRYWFDVKVDQESQRNALFVLLQTLLLTAEKVSCESIYN